MNDRGSGQYRKTLEAAAFDVVRYLRDHRGYGGSKARAFRALRRRRPENSPDECRAALEECDRLLTTAKDLARNHMELLRQGWDAKRMTLDLGDLDDQLSRAFPFLQKHTCTAALQWVFYWHYLR
jgi:hypothetical protein